MKKYLLLCLFAFATLTGAEEFKLGKLVISQPYARATVPGASNGAAFMIIMNDGSAADKLISISTTVAKTAELHTHIMQNGIARMREVAGVDIPAKGKAELKPGSFHVMLMTLNAPLKAGDSFIAKLKFEKAGVVEVTVVVVGLR